MHRANDVLTRIKSQRLWSYFHKDWLLQMRASVREQLPTSYAVFVESEALVVAPPPGQGQAAVARDLSITRAAERTTPATPAVSPSRAVVAAEEPYELLTTYSPAIRRAPGNRLIAACELLSPTNKGVFGPTYVEQYLRKRDQDPAAGIDVLEIDALVGGERLVPPAVARLASYPRHAWTVSHAAGRRRWRGWGWSADEAPPAVAWTVDVSVEITVDLAGALERAMAFNPWEDLIGPVAEG